VQALRTVKEETQKLIFIELNFSSGDCPPALQALSERLKSGKL